MVEVAPVFSLKVTVLALSVVFVLVMAETADPAVEIELRVDNL